MTGIVSALQDLVSSILSVFHSIFNTLFSALEGVAAVFGTSVEAIFNLFRSLLAFFISMLTLQPYQYKAT